jgi:hypothetical protein
LDAAASFAAGLVSTATADVGVEDVAVDATNSGVGVAGVVVVVVVVAGVFVSVAVAVDSVEFGKVSVGEFAGDFVDKSAGDFADESVGEFAVDDSSVVCVTVVGGGSANVIDEFDGCGGIFIPLLDDSVQPTCNKNNVDKTDNKKLRIIFSS